MDPISDMLIRIKNAGMAGRPSARVSYSRMKKAVAELLEREGYISKIEEEGEGVKREIVLHIAYKEQGTEKSGAKKKQEPRVESVKRVSKPSRRVYMGVRDMKPVRQGYGALILSTPKGIMTDKEAKKEHVGGEALFEIY